MPPYEYDNPLFRTFLSGLASPFPNIYDAISEQILLLIFKARQLNEHSEFRKWFDEQHQVLTKLRDQSDIIREIRNPSKHMPESKQDSLMEALFVMHQLYKGFDDGKISLKTWGGMHWQPLQQFVRFTEENKRGEKFIQDDLFDILTEVRTHCSPIPPKERKGYCHQDLSIAHSCSSELLSLLDDFHKIDSLTILADSIYILIAQLRRREIAIPDYLSQFDNIPTYDLSETRRRTDGFHKIVKLINAEGRIKFVERLSERCEPLYANDLFEHFVGIYTSDIMHWLTNLHRYFHQTQSVPFEWKFTTVASDTNPHYEEEEQPSVAWESDYCQISIKRDTLLNLIQTNALHDAADYLADCLEQIYSQSAEEICRQNGAIQQISDQVHHVNSLHRCYFYNATPRSAKRSAKKSKDILQSFEKWHENNKELLVSRKRTRTERISVEVRLAGLKCYDLKMGIPSGSGMKIKDGVYDLVKQDPNLRFENSISDISLQRYHSQVKKIIEKDIDVLLQSQQNNNSRYPFSGAALSIKPLWGKSEYHEVE
ncbi:hypothetical protein KS670_004555 [Vibrio parahaemolyticus]|nr:hypothetical protein [Vibrio parahaemolyticus]MBM5068207.1 hypothetical protein [Vibrio parahaemolyticus]